MNGADGKAIKSKTNRSTRRFVLGDRPQYKAKVNRPHRGLNPSHSSKYIVVSYCSKDSERVGALVGGLSDEGLEVWWDEYLNYGEGWNDEIAEKIDGASAVMVVWTTNSVDSDHVRHEAQLAKDHNKLVPVLLDSDIELPSPHTQYHWSNLSDWTPRSTNDAFDKIVSVLKDKCGVTRQEMFVLRSDLENLKHSNRELERSVDDYLDSIKFRRNYKKLLRDLKRIHENGLWDYVEDQFHDDCQLSSGDRYREYTKLMGLHSDLREELRRNQSQRDADKVRRLASDIIDSLQKIAEEAKERTTGHIRKIGTVIDRIFTRESEWGRQMDLSARPPKGYEYRRHHDRLGKAGADPDGKLARRYENRDRRPSK